MLANACALACNLHNTSLVRKEDDILKVIVFTIGSYKFAATYESIAAIKTGDMMTYQFPDLEKHKHCFEKIKPTNITKQMIIRDKDFTAQQHYLYYTDRDTIRCLIVNSIDEVKEIEKSEVFYCNNGAGSDIKGIIGYINNASDIISFIDIPDFLSLYGDSGDLYKISSRELF